MVCKRNDRIFFGGRLIAENQFIRLCKYVFDFKLQLARKALFACGTCARKAYAGFVFAFNRLCLPYRAVVAFKSPVKAGRAVVRIQRKFGAVQRKTGIRNSVRVAAYARAEIGFRIIQIAFERRIAQHDIAPVPFFVGHRYIRDNAAVVGNRKRHCAVVRSVKPNLCAVGQDAEAAFRYFHVMFLVRFFSDIIAYRHGLGNFYRLTFYSYRTPFS